MLVQRHKLLRAEYMVRIAFTALSAQTEELDYVKTDVLHEEMEVRMDIVRLLTCGQQLQQLDTDASHAAEQVQVCTTTIENTERLLSKFECALGVRSESKVSGCSVRKVLMLRQWNVPKA